MQASAKPLLNNRYQKVKKLGEGAYGVVYLAIDTKPQAVKRRADDKALQQLNNVAAGVGDPFRQIHHGAIGGDDAVMKDDT